MKRIIINEKQYKLLLEMAYPTSFNMDEFKMIKSFKDRYTYCKQRLQYIKKGSSRAVFAIDDDKVLKLAINKKGLDQNDTEIGYANYTDVIAKIYDFCNDDTWLEMERVVPITPVKFEQITGIAFNLYCFCLRYFSYENRICGYNTLVTRKPMGYDDLTQNNQFLYDMLMFMSNFDAVVGDLVQISSYGMTKRGEVKLIDAGLSETVWEDNYKKNR